MAFAALEAMEEIDLFGVHGGGPSSKIHVMLDEAQKVWERQCFVQSRDYAIVTYIHDQLTIVVYQIS